jgi:hypothetical protein
MRCFVEFARAQCPPNGLRISGGRAHKLACGDDHPLHPLDGWRQATDKKRMAIRRSLGGIQWQNAFDPVPGVPGCFPEIHGTLGIQPKLRAVAK